LARVSNELWHDADMRAETWRRAMLPIAVGGAKQSVAAQPASFEVASVKVKPKRGGPL
jgi:hypothetical protein